MIEGIVFKALSGFYYVDIGTDALVECRARGRLRKKDEIPPMVGDKVLITTVGDKGVLESVFPRRNAFLRPPVANLDQMVIFASGALPITEPFLIDRIAALCELNDCVPLICINKCDLNMADELFETYYNTGYQAIRVSAKTGEGIEMLKDMLKGKVSAFTGNSGVGKSSVLNALESSLSLKTDDVSYKLGRGKHTTRHVEMFRLGDETIAIDTPGFSAFNTDVPELLEKDNIQYAFPEFSKYIGECQFRDCSHIKEKGCAILCAVNEGKIRETRYSSYVRLYEYAKKTKKWELPNQ